MDSKHLSEAAFSQDLPDLVKVQDDIAHLPLHSHRVFGCVPCGGILRLRDEDSLRDIRLLGDHLGRFGRLSGFGLEIARLQGRFAGGWLLILLAAKNSREPIFHNLQQIFSLGTRLCLLPTY